MDSKEVNTKHIEMRAELRAAYNLLRDTVDKYQKDINAALVDYQSLDAEGQYNVQDMMKRVAAANAALYALGTVSF